MIDNVLKLGFVLTANDKMSKINKGAVDKAKNTLHLQPEGWGVKNVVFIKKIFVPFSWMSSRTNVYRIVSSFLLT